MADNSKRNLAVAVCLAVLVGVIAWVMVDRWLAAEDDSPQIAVEVSPETDREVPKGPNDKPSEAPAPSPDKTPSSPPPDSTEFVATFPVKWLSPPDELPDGGYELRMLRSDGEEVDGSPSVLLRERVGIRAGLPDGRYTWISRDELSFRSSPSSISVLTVENGECSLKSAFEVDGEPALGVWFMVPVELHAEISGADSAELGIAAFPRARIGHHLKALCRDQQRTPLWVPRAPLSINPVPPQTLAGQPPDGDPFEVISCSLNERAPVRNEVIRITLSAYPRLTLNLIEQNPGDLRELLSPPGMSAMYDDSELEDGPRDEWYFTASVNGLLESGDHKQITFERVNALSLPDGDLTTSILIPPLKEDKDVRVRVSGHYRVPLKKSSDPSEGIRNFLRRTPDIVRFVGYGEARLRRGDADHNVDVIVRPSSWTFEIEAVDTLDRPRPDLGFTVDVFGREFTDGLGRTRRLQIQTPYRNLRTDEEGRIVLDGLPVTPGGEIRVRPDGWDLPPEVDSEFSGKIRVESGSPGEKVKVVLPADFAQPLVLRFDRNGLPPELREQLSVKMSELTRVRMRVPVRYIVIPHQLNERFETDHGRAGMMDDLRVRPRLTARGRYLVVVISPAFGELTFEVNHSGRIGDEVTLVLESFRSVSVRVVDDDGEPLGDTIIYTSGLEPVTAWSLAAMERSRHFTLSGSQKTRDGGNAKFPCRDSRLNPKEWTLHHPAHGLFHPKEVTGSAEDGFVLSGVRKVPSGTLVVSIDESFERDPELEYQAAITPIYSRNDPNRSDVLVGMGRTMTFAGESVTFTGLPEGRYMVTIIAKGKGSGVYYRLPGGTWNAEVDVRMHKSTNVSFP